MFKASAPGSVMLLGEHACLHGYSAIVAAIDKHMTVSITPNNTNNINITAELGAYSCEKHNISIEKPFTFILASLKNRVVDLPSGCDIHIESDFSSTFGLGSSAAVTVALQRCLSDWLGDNACDHNILQQSAKIIRAVQGIGSGADCAASVYGGVIYYKADLCAAEKLAHKPEISLVYSGYKTPTVSVIEQIAKKAEAYPALYHSIYKKIGACAEQGRACIQNQDWEQLGALFYQQQQLMAGLGASDEKLDALIKKAESFDTILAAKISGSGLGDCIVTLGALPEGAFDERLQLNISIA